MTEIGTLVAALLWLGVTLVRLSCRGHDAHGRGAYLNDFAIHSVQLFLCFNQINYGVACGKGAAPGRCSHGNTDECVPSNTHTDRAARSRDAGCPEAANGSSHAGAMTAYGTHAPPSASPLHPSVTHCNLLHCTASRWHASLAGAKAGHGGKRSLRCFHILTS